MAIFASLALLFVSAEQEPGVSAGTSPDPVQVFTVEMPREMADFQIRYRPAIISRDGERIILHGIVGNRTQLYFRSKNALQVVPIRGTEDVASVFALSPDGKWIAFTVQGDQNLRKVPSSGGVPIEICQGCGRIWGISWNHPDFIVFDSDIHNGLLRVGARGGEPETISAPEPGEIHKQPYMLDNGNAVLFTIGSRGATMRESDTLAVLSLEDGSVRRLVAGASPRVSRNGLLVFFRRDALWAARFDMERLQLAGESVPVAEDIHYDTEAHYSLSDNGTLVYVLNTNFVQRQLVWVDKTGIETPLPLEAKPYLSPRVAPEGERVAAVVDSPGGADLWVFSLDEKTAIRLTYDESREASPVWHPRGSALYYSSERVDNLYASKADRLNAVEQLTDSDSYDFAYSLSPDGTKLYFTRVATHVLPGSPGKLMSLDLGTKSESLLPTESGANRFEPALSPNGKLLAYSMLQDGLRQVYVTEMSQAGRVSWQVSQIGGSQPVWAPDSSLLYYWGPKAIMRARVSPEGRGIGKPEVFVNHDNYIYYDVRNFDVSPDGQRILVVKGSEENTLPMNKIVLAQNWLEHVERKIQAQEGEK